MRRFLPTLGLLGLIVLGACMDSGPRQRVGPTAPGIRASLAEPSALEIQTMIAQLLANDAGLKNAALAQFNNVAKSMDAQKYDVAQNQAGALISFMLKQSNAGKLSSTTDVFGGTSATLAADQALSQLVAAIYSFLHVPGSDLTKIDAAAAYIAHDAPETLVKTGTGLAAVRIPTGALGGDALVTITPISYLAYAPGDGPLFTPSDPTKVPQYPYYYEISAYAVGSEPIASPFHSPVLVEICQIETGPFAPAEAIHPRLVLAHKTANGVEFLRREYAGDLACTPTVPIGSVGRLDRPMESEGLLAMGIWQLRNLPSRAMEMLTPDAAFAGHGGLGGLTSSFSPFGAVDVGSTPSPVSLSMMQGAQLQLTGPTGTTSWGSSAPYSVSVTNPSVLTNAAVVPGGVVTALTTSPAVITAYDASGRPLQSWPVNTSSFSNFPRTTVLAWPANQQADHFRVKVDYCENWTLPDYVSSCTSWKPQLSQDPVVSNSLSISFIGAQPGRWSVEPFDGGTSVGAVSPYQYFRYTN